MHVVQGHVLPDGADGANLPVVVLEGFDEIRLGGESGCCVWGRERGGEVSELRKRWGFLGGGIVSGDEHRRRQSRNVEARERCDAPSLREAGRGHRAEMMGSEQRRKGATARNTVVTRTITPLTADVSQGRRRQTRKQEKRVSPQQFGTTSGRASAGERNERGVRLGARPLEVVRVALPPLFVPARRRHKLCGPPRGVAYAGGEAADGPEGRPKDEACK